MKNKKSIRNLYQHIREDFQKSLVLNGTYREINNRLAVNEEMLRNSIHSTEYALLDEFIKCEYEMSSFESEESFVYGFICAIKIFIDSLKE